MRKTITLIIVLLCTITITTAQGVEELSDMMEMVKIVSIVIFICSIVFGYFLFTGGDEIKNNKIKLAGALWLFMVGISALFILVSYSEITKGLEEPDAYDPAASAIEMDNRKMGS